MGWKNRIQLMNSRKWMNQSPIFSIKRGIFLEHEANSFTTMCGENDKFTPSPNEAQVHVCRTYTNPRR